MVKEIEPKLAKPTYRILGISISKIAFVVLIAQTSSLILVLRHSRTLPGQKYLPSTVVILTELSKLILSLIGYLFTEEKWSLSLLYQDILGAESDWLKMMVPAVLYFVQNLINFVAISNLDAATFQVTAQLKLPITAIFSVMILKTHLSKTKWTSLFAIMCGIVMVTLAESGLVQHESENRSLGFMAVVSATMLSGFTAIWFEAALKGKTISLFVRNIQLSLFSIIPGFFFAICYVDGAQIIEDGFFQGYSVWTWIAIANQALGGLTCAVVVK
ncbi:hypothetical protein HDV02_004500 [Globomyces sp. JEL0801]|nr:hypothetical protein HDV02_004500 [Globomyces sp. JEL0801]